MDKNKFQREIEKGRRAEALANDPLAQLQQADIERRISEAAKPSLLDRIGQDLIAEAAWARYRQTASESEQLRDIGRRLDAIAEAHGIKPVHGKAVTRPLAEPSPNEIPRGRRNVELKG